MNSADNMTPSSMNTDDAVLHLEFRRLPVEKLVFPQELFKRRVCAPDSEPQMLLTPLIVRQDGDAYAVIDGCKRLLQARKAGVGACDCGILTSPSDQHRASLLRIALNRGRILHFSEKLLFIRWLGEHCDERHYRAECAHLRIDNKERFEFEQLARCDEAVIYATESGTLEACLAPEVNRLEVADRDALLHLLKRHPFSRQMQRELLDWLPELAFREKCTVADVIAAPWLREIELHVKLNGPQKIERLRAALFTRRFPTLARARETWNTLAAKLNPDPQRITFKPAEAFENNRLELKITITSAESAPLIFNRLAAITAGEWNQLIYPAQLFSRDDLRSSELRV